MLDFLGFETDLCRIFVNILGFLVLKMCLLELF
jgi:hypothetical protein